MVYSNGNLLNFALPLPITQTAQQTAAQFARLQPNVAKSEQVRLNTLAVCVVSNYLQMMGISTNLTAGDSWQPVMQLCADTADLAIVGIGRLECRPLNIPNLDAIANQTCPVPPEVWEDRIGYVVVQIDESQQEANLLGFVETVQTEDLPLSQLNPPEALLDHLDHLLHPVTSTAAAPSGIQTAERVLTTLGRWFQNSVETGWQAVEDLLRPDDAQLAYGFRGDAATVESADVVRRAKPVNLGLQSPLALLVEISSGAADEVHIRLQLHPTEGQPYLPPEVQLTVLDGSDAVFLEAESRAADNYIQLELSGQPGEAFRVRIRCGEISVTEDFVI